MITGNISECYCDLVHITPRNKLYMLQHKACNNIGLKPNTVSDI